MSICLFHRFCYHKTIPLLCFSSIVAVSCVESELSTKPETADGDTESNIEEIEELAPDIQVTPDTINFGIVYSGDEASDVFRISNVGDGSLLVDQVEIITGSTEGYSITLPEPLPWRLETGEYKDVVTNFYSQDTQVTIGEVRIVSTDPDEMITLVTLVDEPYELPEETLEGCEGVANIELSEELMVWSWDSGPAVGTVEVDTEGMYHVYSDYIAESGSSQTNESAYLRISNMANPDGIPEISNCNDDWIVADLDNGASIPSGTVAYVGTFYLVRGENTVSFYHYCPLYRDGECVSFHISTDSNSTCDTNNPNSVHFTGTAICLLPAG
jgi:hypothetical protein